MDPVSDTSEAEGVSGAEDDVGVPGFLREERLGGGGSMTAEAEPRLRCVSTPSRLDGDEPRECGGCECDGCKWGVGEMCRPMAICWTVGRSECCMS